MRKFILNKENLVYNENLPISITQIFDVNNPDIEKTIQNFHDLYKWDNMFTVDEVQKRLDDDCKFFLFYLNGILVGHAWFSNKTHSYSGTDKEFQFPELFSFNIFVSKAKHSKSVFDSFNYYSYCVSKVIADGYTTIHIEIDDWNDVSMNYFKKVGFIEY